VNTTAINALIDAFLEKLRPKIKEFLTGSRLAAWEPSGTVDQTTREFYRTLAIPTIKGNRPNLLLHDLVASANPHIDKLFRDEKHW
jgi:hypothetical protein